MPRFSLLMFQKGGGKEEWGEKRDEAHELMHE